MKTIFVCFALLLGASVAFANDVIITEDGTEFVVPDGYKAIAVPKIVPTKSLRVISNAMAIDPSKPTPPTGNKPLPQCNNYDFYDWDSNGTVDSGPAQGCTYDPCQGPASCY